VNPYEVISENEQKKPYTMEDNKDQVLWIFFSRCSINVISQAACPVGRLTFVRTATGAPGMRDFKGESGGRRWSQKKGLSPLKTTLQATYPQFKLGDGGFKYVLSSPLVGRRCPI